MQALKLDATTGWRWVVGGWRLFRAQPFSFIALLFFYWLLLLCASAIVGWIAQALGVLLPFVPVDVIAAVGGLLVAVLTPTLTVGFLQACRAAASGLPVHPVLLFAPFRAGRTTLTRLLTLGAYQMVALIVIILATSGVAGFRAEPAIPPAATQAGGAPPAKAEPRAAPVDPSTPRPMTQAEQDALRGEAVGRMLQALAYLPVALVMWYAPLLVAWHGLPAGKALFFSLVAVWRNKSAFVVYGATWLVIWLVLSTVIALITGLVGVGNFAAVLVVPMAMLLLTCMYCSMYPTYATVFVDPVVPAPAIP